ncbi:4-hydroxythreonine-4-phosphate dehydrogenase PdxA [Enhydrobacter sp.]|uniref:4-hydroxythreonine-4-phosphate dehydrogenase PdxA n=1 Tax=Enhydrobacter sp. TaxID=1894999 RepID=UPI0026182320|nr:4-hydroxythreonine-4-phosphate dehydrogenase PdxA [Enhydrobacter sp.]WIM14211.1 MAG: 4-hydroxythreonine-4-phosphate dehydrogenase [Enhydrobacter sp.]
MTVALPLAVTMGEPAGIGGELSLKAWLARTKETRPFFVLDDPGRLETLARHLGLAARLKEIARPDQAIETFPSALPVLPVRLRVPVQAGRPDPANAPATIEAIERAAALAMAGEIAGFATNPIQKKTLQEAGFSHPGHTEFLADLAARAAAKPVEVAMMLACPELRVVPVTIHLSLAEAVRTLDAAAIVRTGRIAAGALKALFGIARPRLAIAALNPHAGEQGAMGDEEIRIIGPAVEALRKDGIDVRGPAPADTLFHPAARATYDVALCMYHDQALIPIKTIDFSGGVNVTLGLPFVRTSPDHGTALDIAGTGRADAGSLIAALAMADDMARRRQSRDAPAA